MSARALRLACRLYAVMLRAYPSRFRREYSREMMLVFESRVRDVVEHGGSWAVLPFMLHVAWDWLRSTLREGTDVVVMVPALRWLAALPAAILAAYAAERIVGFFVRTDFAHIWIPTDITCFVMAAAFVRVGVWVAPSRKDSAARIALSVVAFWSVLTVAWGALSMALRRLSGASAVCWAEWWRISRGDPVNPRRREEPPLKP